MDNIDKSIVRLQMTLDAILAVHKAEVQQEREAHQADLTLALHCASSESTEAEPPEALS